MCVRSLERVGRQGQDYAGVRLDRMSYLCTKVAIVELMARRIITDGKSPKNVANGSSLTYSTYVPRVSALSRLGTQRFEALQTTG